MDRDGNLDVVASNLFDDTFAVFLGDGAGGLGTATPFNTSDGPLGLALGDLDDDGALDVVFANFFDDTVSFSRGDGNGGFLASTDFPVGAFPDGVAIADLNGDGAPDVVSANSGGSGGNSISVLTNRAVRRWVTVWQSNEDRDSADRDNDIFSQRTTNALNGTP